MGAVSPAARIVAILPYVIHDVVAFAINDAGVLPRLRGPRPGPGQPWPALELAEKEPEISADAAAVRQIAVLGVCACVGQNERGVYERFPVKIGAASDLPDTTGAVHPSPSRTSSCS